jgi:hypothetical protein
MSLQAPTKQHLWLHPSSLLISTGGPKLAVWSQEGGCSLLACPGLAAVERAWGARGGVVVGGRGGVVFVGGEAVRGEGEVL